MRKKVEIEQYINEAFDKVWYCRSEVSDIPDIEKKRLETIKNIEAKYNKVELDNLKASDFKKGYESGILVALRWVLGEEKDMLDT